MGKLSTIVISDGRPGHFRLSEGICAALERLYSLDVCRLEVRRPPWIPARALSFLAPNSNLTPVILNFAPTKLPRCDLIISAGGDTLAANVWLSKHFACPNVFYGSLRRYRATDFTLVLTSYASRADGAHQVMTLKPSAYDPDAQRAKVLGGTQPRSPVYGLLIGGDSGTVRFTPHDWEALVGLVGSPSVLAPRWMISNSRRTPPTASDTLAALAADCPNRITFVDVRKPGARPLAELLAQCDAIAVTIDSSSMVSEAVWARKPVICLAPIHDALPALERTYRDHLAAAGHITTLALADVSLEKVAAAFERLTVLATNPLDDLASLLNARLSPQLRVQTD